MCQLNVNCGSVVIIEGGNDISGFDFNYIKLTNVQNGIWNSITIKENNKVKSLISWVCNRTPTVWKKLEQKVGNDGGTLGIWNADSYPKTHDEQQDIYNWICDFKKTNEPFVYKNIGVNSNTGYGDGLHSVYVYRNLHHIIEGIKLEFMDCLSDEESD